jgi:two-component system cell cycle sensor histidine kinase/response regulator CckA
MSKKPTHEELEQKVKELEKEAIRHKRAEEEKETARIYLHSSLASITDGVMLLDKQRKFVYMNSAFLKLHGFEAKDFIGKTVQEILPPLMSSKMTKTIAERMKKSLKSGESINGVELEVIDKDNKMRPVSYSASPIGDEKGNIIGEVYFIRDITERKQTEEALHREKEKFRALLEKSPLGISLIDNDGNYKYINPTFIEMFGYTLKDVPTGRVWFRKAYPDQEYRNKVISAWMSDLSESEGGTHRPRTFTVTCKDGSKKIIQFRAATMEAGDQFVICEDITEQQKLQARLRQAQKMEAIATLAGGIAHEFNNTLVGITGNIDLLQMDLPEEKTISKYTERMKVSARRMAHLTDQLLAYARGGKYHPKNISLTDFVEKALPFIRQNIDPSIHIEMDLSKDIFNVEADITQMQMVLSAIVNNSVEAIEDQGRIMILVKNEKIEEKFAKNRPGLKPGNYVSLTVEDDGKGMDKETRGKIFDPFFTTKFQGRGLGMAAVYGIVKNHGGWISVDSELGKGTVVRIYLPAIKVQMKKPEKARIELTKGTETILVIEDEDVVIDVILTMLKRLGYHVLLAKTGTEAINISKGFDGVINLAILDIKLPDMGGNKVYRFIKKARPSLKVIVCSGYAIDGPAQGLLDAGAQGFIQKPFSYTTLSEKLKEVLEGK